MKYKFDFYTQFNQFYLTSDRGSALKQGSLKWSHTDYNDRFGAFKNMIVIFSGRYGHIKGELDLLEHPNTKVNYSLYEHIVECGIEAHSGVLEILDCPTSTVASYYVTYS